MPIKIPPDVLKWFQRTGSEGGKARAAKYTKEQLAEWGKKGGRPKGSRKKQAPKATATAKTAGKTTGKWAEKKKGAKKS